MAPKLRGIVWIPVLILLMATACGGDYYPKPHGNFRIDLPEKEYIRFDTTFPYSFSYPAYARIAYESSRPDEPYWINVEFPRFRGKIHLSYKPVNGNLNDYLEDSRTMAMKHIPKASGIKTETFVNADKKVYGLTYLIEGVEAASPFQFYITDSTSHFIRGALYFNVVPNNDSLAPVIEFLEDDIRYMIETFEWKTAP
jgi:gliding motility-associated lipoprotein GldD